MQEFRLVTLAGCRVLYCPRAVPLKNPTVSGSTGQDKNVRVEPSSLGGDKVSTPQTSPGMNVDMIAGVECELLSSCVILLQWSEILRISSSYNVVSGGFLNLMPVMCSPKVGFDFIHIKLFVFYMSLWFDCTHYYKICGIMLLLYSSYIFKSLFFYFWLRPQNWEINL